MDAEEVARRIRGHLLWRMATEHPVAWTHLQASGLNLRLKIIDYKVS